MSKIGQTSRDLADIVNTKPLSESIERITFSNIVGSLESLPKSVDAVFEKLPINSKVLLFAKKSWENVKNKRLENGGQ